MKKIGNFELDKVYCGDSKELTKGLPDNSIDLIVTDPPYQLSSIQKRFGKDGSAEAKWGKDGSFRRVSKGFMGKKWDVLPPIEVWQESLRVLKPGAFAFIMTTPRQDSLCQILMDLSNAGFCMGFTSIYWTYASGFPKASNMGKMADKRRIGSQFKSIREYLRESWQKSGKTQKYLKKAMGDLTTGGGRISHYFGTAQASVPNWEDWCILKKELDMDDRFDYFIKEYEREILGIKTKRKESQWCKTSKDNNTYITEPVTKEAKSLEGSYAGFQPKPAVEVIIVAMKPLSEKSYTDQALKNRKGITWLDNGRIPYESEGTVASNPKLRVEKGYKTKTGDRIFCQGELGKKNTMVDNVATGGRFPANLLVSDDVLNDGRVRKSNTRNCVDNIDSNVSTFGSSPKRKVIRIADSGSFSRYFDLDKWYSLRGNQNARKHNYNQDYFAELNNENAYWLGFILGDGWVGVNKEKHDYRLQINLQLRDLEHLLKFALHLGNENLIKIKEDSVTLLLASKRITQDLIKLGIPHKNKTFKAKKLDIDNEYIKSFWRGMFDADGCIRKSRNSLEIKITGTNNICKEFSKYLGYEGKYVDKKGNIFEFRKHNANRKEIIRLYQLLYDGEVCLERKQNIFLDYLKQFQLTTWAVSQGVKDTFPFLIVPKASKSEKNKGLDFNPIDNTDKYQGKFPQSKADRTNVNKHPTVKPIKLMSYLITLGSRKGDIILDNFCGSGSTLISAKMLNRRFLGFDTEMEYVKISRARLSAVKHVQVSML